MGDGVQIEDRCKNAHRDGKLYPPNMKFTGSVSDPVERLVGRSLIVLSVLVKGEPLFSVNSSFFLELRKMSALSYPYESSICLAGNGIGFLANLGIPSLQDK